MKISPNNALTFFSTLDQAKTYLLHWGDRGKPYIERLKEIRGTFTPTDFDQSFLDDFEAVARSLEKLTEPDMRPVTGHDPIKKADEKLPPEVEKAVKAIRDAIRWLKDLAE